MKKNNFSLLFDSHSKSPIKYKKKKLIIGEKGDAEREEKEKEKKKEGRTILLEIFDDIFDYREGLIEPLTTVDKSLLQRFRALFTLSPHKICAFLNLVT